MPSLSRRWCCSAWHRRLAGEFRHGSSVPTFLISPRRRDVVMAKLVTITGLGAVVGATSFGLAVAVAVPALAHKGIHHLAGDTPQMWIAATIATALFGAAGIALGSIIPVGANMSITHTGDSTGLLQPWVALIVLVTWVVASSGVATRSILRRDVFPMDSPRARRPALGETSTSRWRGGSCRCREVRVDPPRRPTTLTWRPSTMLPNREPAGPRTGDTPGAAASATIRENCPAWTSVGALYG
jgi:hypothetical protein